MSVSYKKLWHILLDRNMKKKDLEALAGISHYTMTKKNKNEDVSTDVLAKVCVALKVDIFDIMEMVPESEKVEEVEK